MTGIRWSAPARRDFQRIVEWYAGSSREAGVRFVETLYAAVDLIRRYPRIGREIEATVRRFVLGGYPCSLIYQVHPAFLRVVAIMHHRQDPEEWRARVDG